MLAGILDRTNFPRLLEALRGRGYRLIGPRIRQAAITYDEIGSVEDLPQGWTDEQSPGHYHLTRRADAALFGYVVGQLSLRNFLHPPELRLWRADLANGEVEVSAGESEPSPRYAFIGVRSCDLHAMEVQDRVFLHGASADPAYRARREAAFFVAINCGEGCGTCFCVSMKTGPRATTGFDLALTELLTAGRHEFLLEAATERGRQVLAELPTRPAEEGDHELAEEVIARAAARMGRTLDTTEIKELLYRNWEHPRWNEVAERCLTCGNCTMVCPTCFCNDVVPRTGFPGEGVEQWRFWDVCYTLQFTALHGKSVRSSDRSRYRQWLTHKVATWWDQFGCSGCIGCGRCITWCPVGIDITEEVSAIRQSERRPKEES